MPSPWTHRAIIVCPAAAVDAANAWVVANADPNGATTFDAPLVDAQGNIVAYWVETPCDDNFWAGLPAVVAQFGGRLYDGLTTTPAQVLATEGLSEPRVKLS